MASMEFCTTDAICRGDGIYGMTEAEPDQPATATA